MNRSTMIRIIELELSKRNTGHYSYDSTEHADMILTAIENAGMLPPTVYGCPGCGGCNGDSDSNCWTDE